MFLRELYLKTLEEGQAKDERIRELEATIRAINSMTTVSPR